MIPHIDLSFLNIYEIEILITNAFQGCSFRKLECTKFKKMTNVVKGHDIFL